MKELSIIQQKLVCPKTRHNKFGNYDYRSASDILDAIKKAAEGLNCSVVVNDELVNCEGRYFIKATAMVINAEGKEISASAYAQIPEKKVGMDESQVTGSASSYARKYALNGLFAIDDTQDSDEPIEGTKEIKSEQPKKKTAAPSKKVDTIAEKEASRFPSWTNGKVSIQRGDEKYMSMIIADAEGKKCGNGKTNLENMIEQFGFDEATIKMVKEDIAFYANKLANNAKQ